MTPPRGASFTSPKRESSGSSKRCRSVSDENSPRPRNSQRRMPLIVQKVSRIVAKAVSKVSSQRPLETQVAVSYDAPTFSNSDAWSSDVSDFMENRTPTKVLNMVKAAAVSTDGDFGDVEFASQAVTSSKLGVWCCNCSTGILRWNSHMFGLFDMDSQPSCIVQYEDFLAKLHPDDRAGVDHKIKTAKIGEKDGAGRYDAEYRVVWRDGSIKTFTACSDHYRGEDGSDLMVGTVFDITEMTMRKQVECENLMLSAALEKEKKHNHETTMVLRTMSHELRNPLQGILGSWSAFEGVLEQVLKQDASPPMQSLISQLRLCMEDQQECVRHQLSTINDLLCFSTVEATPLKIQTIKLDHTIAGVVKMFSNPAMNKGLTITQTPTAGLWCRSDEKLIKRVLVNLFSNSLKFTTEGGITVNASKNDDMISISVADTGSGIPKEFHDKLFATIGLTDTNCDYAGSGLGLNIAQKLATKLGGSISHRPNEPQGTIMTLTFCDQVANENFDRSRESSLEQDDAPIESNEIQLSVEEQLSILETKRILVAEDNSINQRVLKRMLEPLVKELVICNNGLDATIKFEEVHRTPVQFDLCLFDIHMPKMGGLEAAKLCLALEPDVPVVFLTGETGETAKKSCRHYSSYDLLIKPCSKADLTRALASAFHTIGHMQ